MSKRIQITLPDNDYQALLELAERQGTSVAQVVRSCLRRGLDEESQTVSPEQRIAAVLRFARYSGPTGDIDQILEEIERGRGLS